MAYLTISGYFLLKACHNKSLEVCDPAEYAYRQNLLLKELAEYVIQRDAPKEIKEIDE